MGLEFSEGTTQKVQNRTNGGVRTLPASAPSGSVGLRPSPDAAASQSQQTHRGDGDMSKFRGRRPAYPTQAFPIIPKAHVPSSEVWNLPQEYWEQVQVFHNGSMSGDRTITQLPQQPADQGMFLQDGGIPSNSVAPPVHQNPQESLEQTPVFHGTYPPNQQPNRDLGPLPQQLAVPQQPVDQATFLQNGGTPNNIATQPVHQNPGLIPQQPIDQSTVIHNGEMPIGGTTVQQVHQNKGPILQQFPEQEPGFHNIQMSGDGTFLHLLQQPVVTQQPIVPQQPADKAIFLQNGGIPSYGAHPQASQPGPGTGQDKNQASQRTSTATVSDHTGIIDSNGATHPQPPLAELRPEPVIQHGQRFEQEAPGTQVVEPNLEQQSRELLVPEMPSEQIFMADFGMGEDLGRELDLGIVSMDGIEANFWGDDWSMGHKYK
jgi:hypothetical protein